MIDVAVHLHSAMKRGLVTQCHNGIRDVHGDLVVVSYKEVLREPIVGEADNSAESPTLIADLVCKDVCVIDTDAQFYTNHSVSAMLSTTKQEKKKNTSQPLSRDAPLSHRLLCLQWMGG